MRSRRGARPGLCRGPDFARRARTSRGGGVRGGSEPCGSRSGGLVRAREDRLRRSGMHFAASPDPAKCLCALRRAVGAGRGRASAPATALRTPPQDFAPPRVTSHPPQDFAPCRVTSHPPQDFAPCRVTSHPATGLRTLPRHFAPPRRTSHPAASLRTPRRTSHPAASPRTPPQDFAPCRVTSDPPGMCEVALRGAKCARAGRATAHPAGLLRAVATGAPYGAAMSQPWRSPACGAAVP